MTQDFDEVEIDLNNIGAVISNVLNDLTRQEKIGWLVKAEAMTLLFEGGFHEVAHTMEMAGYELDREKEGELIEMAVAYFDKHFDAFMHAAFVAFCLECIAQANYQQALTLGDKNAKRYQITDASLAEVLTRELSIYRKRKGVSLRSKGRKPGKSAVMIEKEKAAFFAELPELQKKAKESKSPTYESDRKRLARLQKKFGTKNS